ncbi:hypothetical protein Gorai_013333 [Gossypium raimondii]|uniref:Uncharacterized protein n=1 Tax=Gossypium raimondii TaxID=29730 RepID=A0A7J8Q5E5_GOSRA|nr:hypothetical protein [Gossypium raimondii]
MCIRQNFEKDCLQYGAKEETLIYALKDCPMAWTILTLYGLDNRLLVVGIIEITLFSKEKRMMRELFGRELKPSVMTSEFITLSTTRCCPSPLDSDGFILRGNGGFKENIID